MRRVVEKYFEAKGVEVTPKQVSDVCTYCRRKELDERPDNIIRFLNTRPHLVQALLLIGLPN